MMSISSAFNAYKQGLLDAWDLMDIVTSYGYDGWEYDKSGLKIFKLNKATDEMRYQFTI